MPRPSSSRVLGVVKVCSYVYPLSNNHGSQGGSDASGYTNYPPRIWPTENFATSRPRWGFGAINHAHAAHTNLQDHAVMQDATGNHQASRGHQVCLSSPEGNAFRKADRAILQRRHYTELAAKRKTGRRITVPLQSPWPPPLQKLPKYVSGQPPALCAPVVHQGSRTG